MQRADIKQIIVNVTSPYRVFVGDCFRNYMIKWFKNKNAFVITDSNVFRFYKDFMCKISSNIFVFEAGEKSKNIDTLMKIYDFLIRSGADRYSYIVGVGGGVVGDLSGFAAATFMRGVNLVHIPTSLLAMVDSAIGGKTGIDYGGYKNMIGSFYQPEVVFVDISFLDTLPEREFISAFGEIVKYGIIEDRKLFEFLENNFKELRKRERNSLLYVVEESIKDKAKIIEEDEKENNFRAVLNFGHTFAHSIESYTDYSTYLHGEAVSVGMVLAAELSKDLGYVDDIVVDRIKKLLSDIGLPTTLGFYVDTSKICEIMLRDKKKKGDSMRFILTRGIGSSIITEGIACEVVKKIIERNGKEVSV